MSEKFEEEIVHMLSPKVKSVLRQTQSQYRDDLEQELWVLLINKVKNSSNFSRLPSFFHLIQGKALENMPNQLERHKPTTTTKQRKESR